MDNFNQDNHFPFPPNPSHHLITIPSSSSSSSRPATNISNNPRKKRTKLMHIGDTHDTLLFKPKHVNKYHQQHYFNSSMHYHEDIPPCTECGKRFLSQKALYGHMRCHPERQWRGINPPPNFRKLTVARKSLHDEMTQEEHEVATYLLMLANGFGLSETAATVCSDGVHEHAMEGEIDQEEAIAAAAAAAVAGTSSLPCGRFECSSCKKVFGSHQALGGHRATHKNVKGCFANTIRSDGTELEDINNGLRIWDVGSERNSVVGGNVEGHRCDICWKVFSSGQALGGHKRCHWEKGDEALAVNPIVRNLDLNLPAQNTTPDQEECSSSGLSLELKLAL